MEKSCSNAKYAWASAMLLGLLIVLCTAPVLAVHDEEFELDNSTTGGNIIDDSGAGAPIDWESLFDPNNPDKPTAKNPLPANFGVATFIRDFKPGAKGPDDSAYTSGSADVNDISSWSCTKKNNLGAKFNIINAYATAYQDPVTQDTILYFALERSGNDGTASAGFWFLGDSTVGCEDTNGGKAEPFTGAHKLGDLLIIADFTGGGKVGNIFVYEWVGSGGSDGPLDLVLAPEDADCGDAGPGDGACATVNRDKLFGFGPGTDIPWLTETKQSGPSSSNDLDERLFMEGGVNLSANNLAACFATYHATTRSSNSLTSEKHDFATGSFPLCSVELSKTCDQDGGYNPSTGKIEIGYSVTVKNTGVQSVNNIVVDDDECGFGSNILNFGPIAGNGAEQTLTGTCSIDPTTDLTEGVENGAEITSVDAGVSVTLAASCVTKASDPGKCFADCGVDADPAIAATKNCVTALVAEDDVVKVKVNYSGTVSNTSDTPQCQLDNTCVSPPGQACTVNGDCSASPVPLINVAVEDNKADPAGQVLLDALGGNPLPTPVRLDPGETAYFEGSYLPDGSGDGYSECPSDASFNDTVTAAGEDIVFGRSVEESAKATCQLCPPGGCP